MTKLHFFVYTCSVDMCESERTPLKQHGIRYCYFITSLFYFHVTAPKHKEVAVARKWRHLLRLFLHQQKRRNGQTSLYKATMGPQYHYAFILHTNRIKMFKGVHVVSDCRILQSDMSSFSEWCLDHNLSLILMTPQLRQSLAKPQEYPFRTQLVPYSTI